MTQVRLIWEWIDNAGGFLRASNWVFATPGLATLEAAIQACANPNLQYVTNGIPTVSTATPGTGQYNLTTDTAVLQYQTAPGSGIRLVIPGPLNTIFGSNSNIVDPTNALIVALNAAVIGTLGDAAGNAASAYISGAKGSRRTEQS